MRELYNRAGRPQWYCQVEFLEEELFFEVNGLTKKIPGHPARGVAPALKLF